MPLTPEAKSALSTTIRELRKLLLRDLTDHVSATYRLSVPAEKAGLGEAEGVRRRRLEGWLEERVRGTGARGAGAMAAARDRFLGEAVREAAATLVNRLVYLRLLEHMSGPDGRPLRRLRLVTGGWSSPAMAEFRAISGPLAESEAEGFDVLLAIVFDDLSVDLPGLFGPVGVTPLIPIPAGTLRHVVEALDNPALASAWDDDTTFGWVYQYWNDPAREALDKKIADGGKIEPHEIASKTQMFTERYMVEWLLQNSLGPTWLAMCRKHGWTADAERILPELEERRAEWRARREAGEVALDALMPIAPGLEDRWKYYVPQDIPAEAVDAAPDTLSDLKLLDPACGSGHFLVIACDLLFALYKEEARHSETHWTDREIVESIVANNLHGIDIDPRAVQIAAAALLLKARTLAPDCRLPALNLVAPAFDLSGLPDDDPALVTLLTEVERETGLPAALTRGIVRALAGASHLGTLLKVEHAVADALLQHQIATGDREPTFDALTNGRVPWLAAAGDDAERLIAERLETFLANHTGGPDLGLRLDGEQLAAGVRFMRLVRPGTYHVVVGNPPYQTPNKMSSSDYIEAAYGAFGGDLFTCFFARGLDLAVPKGLAAFVAYQSWMYNSAFEGVRREILSAHGVRLVADLHKGAFSSVKLVPIALNIFSAGGSSDAAIFIRPLPRETVRRDDGQVLRNTAALTFPAESYRPNVSSFRIVDNSPLVYTWDEAFFRKYEGCELVKRRYSAKKGTSTGLNDRFVRLFWEVKGIDFPRFGEAPIKRGCSHWEPFVLGAKGRKWIEPLREVVNWQFDGVEITLKEGAAVRNLSYNFAMGAAFSMIGDDFSARIHRYRSVIGDKGSSVYGDKLNDFVLSANTAASLSIIRTLNPGIGFQLGDVLRLPLFPIEGADEIYATLDAAFTEHEAARETSVEFRRPGPSAWTAAQEWAQRAVDRPAGEPLPPYEPVHEDPPPVAWVSYAFGQAMGRFGREGQGILNEAPADSLPHGILFLSAAAGARDGLELDACAALRGAWDSHGGAIKPRAELRDWLRTDFFKIHGKTYENRPIWLPLSSAKRTFVAWVALHRFGPRTLDELRALWLLPERTRLDGRLADLRRASAEAGSNAERAGAEKEWATVAAQLDELTAFLDLVTTLAEEGPPPTGPACPPREVSAPLDLDLDDGVMINAAALWPLLAPQWKDPAKWWEELAKAQGRKDYDWSKLAARYWPYRVDGKCQDDPSLAVAHGCFWRYHPARAYAWELRLQDEIRPDFTLDEAGSDDARSAFLAAFPREAEAIRDKERKRREKKAVKAEDATGRVAEDEGDEDDESDEDAAAE